MKNIKEEKRIMDLEYNLICDFIKLRNELGLSQQKMADEVGIVREMIAVIENRKKLFYVRLSIVIQYIDLIRLFAMCNFMIVISN